jgi:hypothetical protein
LPAIESVPISLAAIPPGRTILLLVSVAPPISSVPPPATMPSFTSAALVRSVAPPAMFTTPAFVGNAVTCSVPVSTSTVPVLATGRT